MGSLLKDSRYRTCTAALSEQEPLKRLLLRDSVRTSYHVHVIAVDSLKKRKCCAVLGFLRGMTERSVSKEVAQSKESSSPVDSSDRISQMALQLPLSLVRQAGPYVTASISEPASKQLTGLVVK